MVTPCVFRAGDLASGVYFYGLYVAFKGRFLDSLLDSLVPKLCLGTYLSFETPVSWNASQTEFGNKIKNDLFEIWY
jgi:hypothetical protein